MISYLAAAIFILSIFQRNDERFVAACAYSILNLIHLLILGDADGETYYASAALFDVAIIFIISRITKIVSTSLYIQRICIIEIILNYVGWIMYETYLDPFAYNVAYLSLQVIMIAILLKKDSENDKRGYQADSRLNYLLLVAGLRSGRAYQHNKAERCRKTI